MKREADSKSGSKKRSLYGNMLATSGFHTKLLPRSLTMRPAQSKKEHSFIRVKQPQQRPSKPKGPPSPPSPDTPPSDHLQISDFTGSHSDSSTRVKKFFEVKTITTKDYSFSKPPPWTECSRVERWCMFKKEFVISYLSPANKKVTIPKMDKKTFIVGETVETLRTSGVWQSAEIVGIKEGCYVVKFLLKEGISTKKEIPFANAKDMLRRPKRRKLSESSRISSSSSERESKKRKEALNQALARSLKHEYK